MIENLSAAESESTDERTVEATVLGSIHEMNDNQLNHLATHADGGTLFHRHEWLAAVEEGLDVDPRHVLVTNSGNPVGFLPNVATELPLPNDIGSRVAERLPLEVVEPPPPGYGGPLVTGDRRAVLDRLFDLGLLSNGRRTLFHRIRVLDPDAVSYGSYLEALGYKLKVTKCTFLLDLGDDWETILERMESGRRRSMRKAVDQEYDVRIENLADSVADTYDQYVANMERVGGTVHPRGFLEAVGDRLADRARVFTATVDGEEVGRYVYLIDEENSMLHHWLSAIGDAADFDRYPSELLHRRGIRWGIERGYDRYSFGPTKPHFSDSVFRFKRKYGATPVPALHWERGGIPGAWHLYDYGRTLFRRSQIDAE